MIKEAPSSWQIREAQAQAKGMRLRAEAAAHSTSAPNVVMCHILQELFFFCEDLPPSGADKQYWEVAVRGGEGAVSLHSLHLPFIAVGWQSTAIGE